LELLYNESKETVGRDYYEDWLDTLSQIRKYAVLAIDITVSQFYKAIQKARKDYGGNSADR